MQLKFLYYDYKTGRFFMLVLGRKPGEYVVIDNNIMVKVIRSSDGDLRLAINAPKGIKIMRGELAARNKA